MEIYIGIGVAVLAIVIFAMLATSMLGMKKKSYEEALAEQRQATNELLGVSDKQYQKGNKTKEKKQKKIGKKIKEKSNAAESEGNTEASRENKPHHHVEFKEPELILETPPVQKEPPKKKNVGKKDRVRPILVNRRDSEGVVSADAPVSMETPPLPASNHFEQIHPKDDLELAHLREETKETKSKATKTTTSSITNQAAQSNNSESKQQAPKDGNTVGKKAAAAVAKQQTAAAVSRVAAPVAVVEVPLVKDSVAAVDASKMAEIVTAVEDKTAIVRVATAASNSASVAQGPIVTVKEVKKMRKAAAGHLTAAGQQHGGNGGVATMATLMPLVRNAEMSRSEVQKFIDMLLNKQLEAPNALDEWSEGKADPVQKLKRQMQEREKQLEAEQEAKAGLQLKLVRLREELNAERAQLNQRSKHLDESLQVQMQQVQRQGQQLQQMQMQLNEACKGRDEHAASLQRHLAASAARADADEARTAQLRLEQQQQGAEAQALHSQLRLEVCQLTEQLRHAADKGQMALADLGTAGCDLATKDQIIRELEQARLNLELQHKADFNQMQSHLHQQNEEIRQLEFNKEEVQKERLETERLICDLRSKLAEAQESALGGNEKLLLQVEVRNLHNQLSSVKGQLASAAIEQQRALDEMRAELQMQREKNNALRERNWKVVEALNVAEARNKQSTKQHLELESRPPPAPAASSAEDALAACRDFVGRLFPNLQTAADAQSMDALLGVAEGATQAAFRQILGEARDAEVHLQAKVERLQDAIVDSETMLRNIHVRVQQEEIDWRSKLNEKDTEIARLKEDAKKVDLGGGVAHFDITNANATIPSFDNSISALTDELQIQVTELQLELSGEQDLRKKTQEKLEALQKQPDSTESLIQELSLLKTALENERSRNLVEESEACKNSNIIKTPQNNCTSTNGPNSDVKETNGQ